MKYRYEGEQTPFREKRDVYMKNADGAEDRQPSAASAGDDDHAEFVSDGDGAMRSDLMRSAAQLEENVSEVVKPRRGAGVSL